MAVTYEIAVEHDGVRHSGDWCILMKELVVYYRGFTASCKVPSVNPEPVAKDLLRELVVEHYVPLHAVPSEIPSSMRLAVHAYANAFDDESVVKDLVDSFGTLAVDSEAFRQLACLLASSVGLIVPFWKHMSDDSRPEQTYQLLVARMLDQTGEIDWAAAVSMAVPTWEGQPIVDCDLCRLEPIAKSVSFFANYLQSASSSSAAACLSACSSAFIEGCYPPGAPERFEHWLVKEALAKSLNQEIVEHPSL